MDYIELSMIISSSSTSLNNSRFFVIRPIGFTADAGWDSP